MYAYFRCGNLAALYLEFSKDLGHKPFFKIKACNGETIFDIPYGQVIFTPGRILNKNRPETKADKTLTHDEQEDTDIFKTPTGAAEN